jgi:hypothetical protein
MILTELLVDPQDFAQRTGWHIKPEGACKDERCIPLPPADAQGLFDVRQLAHRLEMPLLQDQKHQLWCLGPEADSHVLSSASLPDIALPDLDGIPFALSSLRGQKVLLLAWASW